MSNSKFKINKKLSSDLSQEAKAEVFASGAENSEQGNFDINEKPKQSFTVPMNSYELSLLQQVANKEDRSMRYMSRKLLVQALENYLSK